MSYQTNDLCGNLIHLINNNELEKAYFLSKNNYTKNNKNPNFLELYGILLIKLDKKKDAIEILKKALSLNPKDSRIKFNLAKISFDLKDYEKSLKLLTEVSGAYANNPQYWNMLGTCQFANNELKYAKDSFSMGLQSDSANLYSLINLGTISRILKDYRDAIFFLEKATYLSNHSIEAWFNLALVYYEIGKYNNAQDSYKKVLEIDPHHAEAYSNLGLTLHELGRFNDALDCYEKAIQLNSSLHLAYYNKGLTLSQLKKFTETVDCYTRALEIDPHHAEAYSNLGLTLHDLGRFNDALDCYEKAIQLDSNLHLAYYNKGLTLLRLKKYDEAINCFNHMLKVDPEHSESMLSIASIYEENKFIDDAIKTYHDLIRSDPNYAEAHHNLALLLLSLFRFSEGWLEYDWRWSVGDCNSSYLQTSKKFWDGKPSNNRILIWSEQGIGDQILYASVLADLVNFPNKKIISVHQKLLPLFQRSFPEFEVVSDKSAPAETEYDEHLPIASLPKFFRSSIDDFKKQKYPYLIPDASKLGVIHLQQLPRGLKCGISWRSSNEKVGEEKSMPLMLLRPILDLPGLVPVNLQYGDISKEIAETNRELGCSIIQIKDLDIYDDIDGLLALIDRCDVVITTSNSTAHLAGAIGKETYLIVPTARGKFWYWHDVDGESLWYPSIRIFKQLESGNWSHPIQEVATQIGRKIGNC